MNNLILIKEYEYNNEIKIPLYFEPNINRYKIIVKNQVAEFKMKFEAEDYVNRLLNLLKSEEK